MLTRTPEQVALSETARLCREIVHLSADAAEQARCREQAERREPARQLRTRPMQPLGVGDRELPGRRPEHPEPALPERVSGASARHQQAGPHPAPSLPPVTSAGPSHQPGTLSVDGATARSLAAPMPSAVPDSVPDSVIERDPAVNRSLLLRLIAGVRGL